MIDTPTLYRRGDSWLYSDRIEDLVDEGVLLRVTEPLLTREEAANDPQVQEMIAQFILKASGWR